jgi:hypothetical protein
MRSTRARTLLVASLTAPTMLFMTPTAAQAARASATVVATSETVAVEASSSYVDVDVTYRCKNTKQVRYFLNARVSQLDVPDTYYSAGYRGETGLVAADCSRGRVTQTVRLARSWWWGTADTQPQLTPGNASLTVTLDARAATDAGWYEDVEQDSTLTQTVVLVSS